MTFPILIRRADANERSVARQSTVAYQFWHLMEEYRRKIRPSLSERRPRAYAGENRVSNEIFLISGFRVIHRAIPHHVKQAQPVKPLALDNELAHQRLRLHDRMVQP
jgi:hypothetical protein